jgi:ElaB/YqjD/DUF883 family membrane-anchored ribosome-binding protein
MAQNTLEVRRDIERIRAELDQTLDALGDHVKPSRIARRRTRGMRRAMTSARVRVMGTASGASDSLHGAQSQLADTASGVADKAKDAPQWIADEARGNPLVAGMVAFGIGMLLGSMAPPTEAERRAVDAMSDQLEPVRQKAVEMAGSVREEMSDATREATQHVREQAQEAAQQVQSSAQDSAAQLKDQAQSGVREVAHNRNS